MTLAGGLAKAGVDVSAKWAAPVTTTKVDATTGDATGTVKIYDSVQKRTVTVTITLTATSDLDIRVQGNPNKGATVWVVP